MVKAEENCLLVGDDFDWFNDKDAPAFDYYDGDDNDDDDDDDDDDDNPDGLWKCCRDLEKKEQAKCIGEGVSAKKIGKHLFCIILKCCQYFVIKMYQCINV